MTTPSLPGPGVTGWHTDWAPWLHAQAAKVAAKLGVADLSASGTPSATTYLRGDGTWATPPGSGGTTLAGHVNSAVVTGTGAADQAATLQAEIDALSAAGGGVLHLPRGIINISSVKLKHLVSLQGKGKQVTVLRHAFTTAEAGAVTVATGPVFANLYDLEIRGTGIAGKHGLYIQAQGQATTPFHGGWWFSEVRNVIVRDFAGDQIWLRGGGEDSLKPIQFCTFTDVEAYTANTRAALRITGQVGQVSFLGNCCFGGASGGGTGTSIVITEEANDDLSYASVKAPYALRFHGTTSERNNVGLYARQVSALTWSDGYMESVKQGINVEQVSQSAIIRDSTFANVGVFSGNGYLVRAGIDSNVIATGNIIGGATPDNDFVCANGRLDLSANVVAGATRQIKTTGLTPQLTVPSDGNLVVPFNTTALVNSSATNITNITSLRAPGEKLHLRAWSGTLLLASGGNIDLLGRTSPATVASGKVATLIRSDLGGTWLLLDIGDGGGSGGTTSLAGVEGIKVHDGTAGGGTRPTGYARIRWVGGTVRPTNMITGDVWERDA